MTRTSRIVGLLFFLTLAAVVVVVVTGGDPESLLRDLDDVRRRYIG